MAKIMKGPIDMKDGERSELQELVCRICFDLLDNPQVTECMHRFCKKCIGQHMRQYDRLEHMCPLCNKEIKTARAVKPDLRVANLIRALYPNHKVNSDSEDDPDVVNNVIRDATFRHNEQLREMRQNQMRTIARQYPQGIEYKHQNDFMGEGHDNGWIESSNEREIHQSPTASPSRMKTKSSHITEYDNFRVAELLGMKQFAPPKHKKARLDYATGSSNSSGMPVDRIVPRSREEVKQITENHDLERFVYCVPPIQVKFRQHPEDKVTLPYEAKTAAVDEVNGFVSVAADATVRELRRAIVEMLFTDSASRRIPKKLAAAVVVKEGEKKGQKNKQKKRKEERAKRNSSDASDAMAPETRSIYDALEIEIPVPIVAQPTAPLLFSGYTFHRLRDPDCTIMEILAWYEGELRSFGADFGGMFDLLLCYKLNYAKEEEEEEEEEEEGGRVPSHH